MWIQNSHLFHLRGLSDYCLKESGGKKQKEKNAIILQMIMLIMNKLAFTQHTARSHENMSTPGRQIRLWEDSEGLLWSSKSFSRLCLKVICLE